MSWELWFTLILCDALLLMLAWWIGWHQGTSNERARAESLCHQAILKRASGSVRWVFNAIISGQKELMPESKFFDKEKPE